MDVICPSCRGRYHETTERYTPDKVADGTMFRLKRRYGPRGYNWSSFPASQHITLAGLECPMCGSCYTDAFGRIRLLELTDEERAEIDRQEKLQQEFSDDGHFEQLMEADFGKQAAQEKKETRAKGAKRRPKSKK